ncbi:MAG: YjfB family protein [Kurthia sp.]|nr:YjfB family protein [Candidatus Kurthia equi]
MQEISSALSAMVLEQQVQLSIVNKAMDTQKQSADALIEAMNEIPMAQDPFRGQQIDISI